jgi:hypothetical protein
MKLKDLLNESVPETTVDVSDEQFDSALKALGSKAVEWKGVIGVNGISKDEITNILDKAGIEGYQISE